MAALPFFGRPETGDRQRFSRTPAGFCIGCGPMMILRPTSRRRYPGLIAGTRTGASWKSWKAEQIRQLAQGDGAECWHSHPGNDKAGWMVICAPSLPPTTPENQEQLDTMGPAARILKLLTDSGTPPASAAPPACRVLALLENGRRRTAGRSAFTSRAPGGMERQLVSRFTIDTAWRRAAGRWSEWQPPATSLLFMSCTLPVCRRLGGPAHPGLVGPICNRETPTVPCSGMDVIRLGQEDVGEEQRARRKP